MSLGPPALFLALPGGAAVLPPLPRRPVPRLARRRPLLPGLPSLHVSSFLGAPHPAAWRQAASAPFPFAPPTPLSPSPVVVVASLPSMLAASKTRKPSHAPRIDNRIARFRYTFLDTFECGISLVGTEIKSVREGKMNLRDGYARVTDGELWLHNVHISVHAASSAYFNHDETRPRRLLLHKRDIRKLASRQQDSGLTMVPVAAYFNAGGWLKVSVALARGKDMADKREVLKKREDDREMGRVLKNTVRI